MNSYLMLLLQVSPSVLEKSAEMAEKDPHGGIITLVSVSVVFSALVILYFAYTLVGKIVNGSWKLSGMKKEKAVKAAARKAPSAEEAAAIALALDQEMNGEAYAAITLALHQYLNDTVHDMESYIITIKRK